MLIHCFSLAMEHHDSQSELQVGKTSGDRQLIVLLLYFSTENNAYSFGRTTIANLNAE